MAIEKINFSYPKGSLQSVFEGEAVTALELAALTSKKVDECVEIVNVVEQTAIEATVIVDEMRDDQAQFITDNNNVRNEIAEQTDTYIDGLTSSKNVFDTDMTQGLADFKTSLNTEKTIFTTSLNLNINQYKTQMDSELLGFKTTINSDKTAYDTAMNQSLVDFKTAIEADKDTFLDNIENQVTVDVSGKIDNLINDGTIENLIDTQILLDVKANIIGNTTSITDLTKKVNFKTDYMINVREYGAKGDGVTDDTQAFKNAIAAARASSVLFIPIGNYVIKDELVINKPLRVRGTMADDLGETYLNFNLDGQASTKVAFLVRGGVNGCVFEDFYMNYSGAANRNGVVFDGQGLNYGEAIWYSKLNGVYARGFADCFKFSNVCVASIINCRAINAKANGFVQTEFATGVTFHSCYAQDCLADGFKFDVAYYSGCFGCYSDGNIRGYHFSNSYGVYVNQCGSESCRMYAVSTINSVASVDGMSTVESGILQSSIYQPTVVYVESGFCSVRNVSEERLISTNTRLYSILFEAGAKGHVETTGHELLDIRVPYDGSCSIDGQFLTQGLPTAQKWKTKDIGKVVYIQNAGEEGVSPNKYILYGYRRMRAGDGNVINVDWLPLRALTGN